MSGSVPLAVVRRARRLLGESAPASLALPPPALLALGGGVVAGLLIALAGVKASPLFALGAVMGLALLVLLVRFPGVGLVLTAALAPIERVGRLTDDAAMYTVSLMRVAGLLALGGLLLNRLLRRKGFVLGAPLLLYAVFVGFSLLSISYSDDLVKSVQMALTFLGNLLFFFLIINLTEGRRSVDAAILAWLVSSIFTGIYATYDWHFGSGQTGGFTTSAEIDPGRGRSTEERMSAVWEDRGELESLGGMSVRRSMGPTSHAAVFGINLILTLPFFLYAMQLRLGLAAKALLGVGGALVAYSIFLTNTRSVIITAAAVGVLCLIRGLVRLSGPQVLAGLAIAGIVLLLVPVDAYNRSLDFANYTPEHSATLRIRLAYWEAALQIIRDHWLTGLGSGNEMAVMQYVRIDAPQASNLHNEYLQTVMEVGVFPALVFFSFVGLLLRYSLRAAAAFRRQPGARDEYLFLLAAQVAMISVLLYGLQVDVFHFPLKGWWLIAGLVFVLHRTSQAATGRRREPPAPAAPWSQPNVAGAA